MNSKDLSAGPPTKIPRLEEGSSSRGIFKTLIKSLISVALESNFRS